MAERMIEANGVELCTESFGDPADPPILLIMGIGASMLWWEEDFCRMLADGGRFVIRYDHRDTGRSVTYEPGTSRIHGRRPGRRRRRRARRLRHPGRARGRRLGRRGVRAAARARLPRARPLARPHQHLPRDARSTASCRRRPRSSGGSLATAEVDWSDAESVIEYLVDYARVLAGGQRPFDEAAMRELVRRDVERARDFAAAQNHDCLADGEPVDASPCPRSPRPRS